MKIVLDAMGSENMPAADVTGAIEAARLYPNDEMILVGRRSLIESGGGQIVTLAAYSVRSPKPNLAPYAAMKSAIELSVSSRPSRPPGWGGT